MKTRLFASLLLFLSPFAFAARSVQIYTCDVSWPEEHLEGTFTMGVDSDFGSYFSTSAMGFYGGLGGTYDVTWTNVELNAQPTLTELRLYFASGAFVGYAVSPSYVGKSSPWTTAGEAWQDLIPRAALDGVYITLVPEPTVLTLLCAGLTLSILFLKRTNRLQATPGPLIS